ncbi:MAG: HlyD family efflux transporter periplasmic adaptor subunit, partial [Rhizobiales bacterium]|nr:HlyD family efflux transporter periplasmic adaptor subunit [Hyphomicrobiales bacterium]
MAVAVVVVGAFYALRPLPVPVDTAVIDRGALSVTIDEEGKTRIREVFMVSAPVAGKMLRAPLEVGDKVIAGKTIVSVIEPTSPTFLDVRSRRELQAVVAAASAAVSLASSEVEKANSELKFAEKDLKRANALSKTSVISEKAQEQAELDVDSKKALLAIAEATLELRRHELNSARARLIEPQSPDMVSDIGGCCIEVRAPVSGQVLKIIAESEQVVASGALLAEIGNPNDLEIIVELLSSAAVKIAPGAPATIENWGGSKNLSAKVTKIEPTGFTKVSALGVEEQRVNVLLELTDPPQDWAALGHEFRVFVKIAQWQSNDVLRAALSALFRDGNDWAVYKLVEGRAQLTGISIDHRNAHVAEVVGGLNEGDEVILYPSDRVDDDVRVI